MRPFVVVLLLTAVVACANANADDEGTIDKRFLFKHNPFKHIVNKAKDVVHDVGKGLEHAGKDIANTAKDVVHKAGDTAVKIGKGIGKTAKNVVDSIVKTFKVEGKYVGHFTTKSGKEVGHFFVQEGQAVRHTLVTAGKKIEHTAKDAYDTGRAVAKQFIASIDFDELLLKIVSQIDSRFTVVLCAEVAKEATVALAPGLQVPALLASPLYHKACEAALHLIEMQAEKGVSKLHIDERIH